MSVKTILISAAIAGGIRNILINRGKSAYQSYLDTTADDPPLSEAEWSAASGSGVWRPPVPGAILVRGAGTNEVNGWWVPTDSANGKPVYLKIANEPDGTNSNLPVMLHSVFDFRILWTGALTGWVINGDLNQEISYYSSADDVATPDLVTTWTNASLAGALPLPEVTGYFPSMAAGTAGQEVLMADTMDEAYGKVHGANPILGVPTVQSGWTDNGGGSFTANIASGYNHVLWPASFEEGGLYLLLCKIDARTAGSLSAYFGQSGLSDQLASTMILSGTPGATAYSLGVWTGATPSQLIIRANNGFIGAISNVRLIRIA